MKQLNKIQSALFLLGGVLMVVGACSFVLKQIYPSLVETTSWVFLLERRALQRNPVDADLRGQVACDPSPEAHPECSQHPLYLCRHLDGGYGLYLYREMAGQSAALLLHLLRQVDCGDAGGIYPGTLHHLPHFARNEGGRMQIKHKYL